MRINDVLGPMGDLFRSGALGSRTDEELLGRFVSEGDEAAFAALVRRHGPMVLRVCRGTLGDPHEAEDACQATFLVLALKAGAICRRRPLAPWLYGVARRVAMKARGASARRRARERPLAEAPRDPASAPPEPMPEVFEELDRLSDRLRAVVVLCDLEGHSHASAADRLGIPEATVHSRLFRARRRLRDRLTRRGLAPSLLASTPADPATGRAPAPPPPDAEAMARLAVLVAGGGSASAGAVPAAIIGLTRGAIRAMQLSMIKAVGSSVMILGLVGLGGVLAWRATATAGGDPAPILDMEGEMEQAPIDPAGRREILNEARADIDSILRRAARGVPDVDDLEDRVWIWCQVARVQARAGLAEPLRETLRKALDAAHETESSQRLGHVAECLAEVGESAAALETAALIPAYARDYTLDHIAWNLARAGDINGALRTAARIQTSPYKEEALRGIARAQAERGEFEAARETAAKIAVGNDKALALADIAAEQARIQAPGAAATLRQAREAAGTNPSSLATLAGLLATRGDIEEAQVIAQGISGEGRDSWRETAWTNIAEAQADRGEIQDALRTTDRIQDDYSKGRALKKIVTASIRANDLATARRVADSIGEGMSRIQALTEIAKAYHREGRRDLAETTFNEVLRGAETLEDLPRRGISGVRRGALMSLARAQAEVGEVDAALAWIDAMDSAQLRVWCLIGMADGIAERHSMQQPSKATTQDDSPPLPLLGQEAADRDAEQDEEAMVRWPIDSFRGKIVLFHTQRIGDLSTPRIEAINPDGTGLETILVLDEGEELYEGRIAPDGSRLAYSLRAGRDAGGAEEGRINADVWVLGTDGERRKLADGGGVVRAWSPDGTSVACLRGKRDEWEHVTIDVETGQERPLPIPGEDSLDDWSPDGETLAVMAGNPSRLFEHPTKGTYPLRQIYLMSRDGAEARVLSADPMFDDIEARFSPDGSRLAYHNRRHQDGRVLHFSMVQDSDGGEARAILNFNEFFDGNAEFRSHGAPCWSPDGTTVAWIVPRKKTRSSDIRVELVFISARTGDVTRLDLHRRGIAWVQDIDWR